MEEPQINTQEAKTSDGYTRYIQSNEILLGSSTPTPSSNLIPVYRERVTDPQSIEKITNRLKEYQLSKQWFSFLAGGVGANRKQNDDSRYSPVDILLHDPLKDPAAILMIKEFLGGPTKPSIK